MEPTPAPTNHPSWFTPGVIGAIGVALVASAVRVAVAIGQPHGLYFPDSWCYIIDRPGAPCMAHDPAMGWFWAVGTLGTRSAASVLWLQAVLGVATALILYRTLLIVTRARWAVAGASLFAVLPVQLLLERTFLTETFETFALVVGLLAAVNALRTDGPWRAFLWTAVAGASMGCALAVHTAFLVPGLISGAVLVILVVRRQWRRTSARAVLIGGMSTVMVLGLLLPAAPEAVTYHDWFGVWTTDVSQGTFLLTRWAPLVSCHVPEDSTPRARAEIRAACKVNSFGAPPGITQWMTWTSPFTYGLSTRHDVKHEQVARTESQLQAVAIAGIMSHRSAFAGQMLASLGWQLVGAPNDDLWQYRSPRLDRFISPWAVVFPNFSQWFGPKGIPADRPEDPQLIRAAAGTTRAGQVLLWTVLVAGSWRLVRRRRIKKPWFPRLTPRTSMGWLTATMIASSMLAVAFGTYPVFRYWSPIMPALIVLCALALTRPKAEILDPAGEVSARSVSA